MTFKKTVQLFLHSPVLFTVLQIGLYIRLFGSIICQKTKRHPDDQHPWHLILQWVLFGQAASRGGNPDHKNGNCREANDSELKRKQDGGDQYIDII